MYGSLLTDRVGRTPLLRLENICRRFHGRALILAKAEWNNPGGSVKDRAAWSMIRAAEQAGALRPGQTILEATSGNTGIALAMLGANRGYPVCLCLPANAGPERRQMLRAYGAELILTDPAESTDGAIRAARALAAAEPDRFYYTDQYSNPANWRAHYLRTALEIWHQTDGRLTHFVATLGTSGTFVGVTRRLKELNPSVRCISVQPDSPFHGIEGLKHMASALVPSIYDPALADAGRVVSTEDAYAMVELLARREGLLVGISSGAALAASLAVAEAAAAVASESSPAIVVTVFPDNADKYLSERFWAAFAHVSVPAAPTPAASGIAS